MIKDTNFAGERQVKKFFKIFELFLKTDIDLKYQILVLKILLDIKYMVKNLY